MHPPLPPLWHDYLLVLIDVLKRMIGGQQNTGSLWAANRLIRPCRRRVRPSINTPQFPTHFLTSFYLLHMLKGPTKCIFISSPVEFTERMAKGVFEHKGIIVAEPPPDVKNIEEISMDHAIEIGAEEVDPIEDTNLLEVRTRTNSLLIFPMDCSVLVKRKSWLFSFLS